MLAIEARRPHVDVQLMTFYCEFKGITMKPLHSSLAVIIAATLSTGCSTVNLGLVAQQVNRTPVCDASEREVQYRSMLQTMQIRESSGEEVSQGLNWRTELDRQHSIITQNKARYITVEADTGIPWQIIAVIHSMEGSLDFKKNLLNGEDYSIKTEKYPPGRGPWSSWEAAAAEGVSEIKERNLVTKISLEKPEALACVFELYNGSGYARKGLSSPYLWSGTNHYSKGKFVERRWFFWFGAYYSYFDPDLASKQLGAMPLLVKLLEENKATKL